MPALTAVLLKRGHLESDIQKIMRINFLRVILAVVGQAHDVETDYPLP
jgi:hypothetical protein